MLSLKFLRLSLLSQKEQSGLQIDFNSQKTLLTAGNGFGKSAIVKSLYETLGARPHKVDLSWREAAVVSLLEFSIGSSAYYALKLVDTYTIFDNARRVLITTNRVTSELGPFLANLLNFRLVLADKQERTRTPPPSYAFAPFYIDQDRSWQRPWVSFSDLGMFPRSPQALSEYHSGMRPNEYYDAKARRDAAKLELSSVDAERGAVHQALSKIRQEFSGAPLSLDMGEFQLEIDRLVREAQELYQQQSEFRSRLGRLNESYNLWLDHVQVIEQAIGEIDDAYNAAIGHPKDVECPMCGHHYTNDIAGQFALKSDQGDLLLALQDGRMHLKEAEQARDEERDKLKAVSVALEKVHLTLAVAKHDVSLRDIVQAEGRTEAQRVLQERLAALESECAKIQRQIDATEERMKSVESKERKAQIRTYFSGLITASGHQLDVPITRSAAKALHGSSIGRGSVSPRALAAYYYSFLHTARQFSSSAFCPIVIDAPNQQGQDQGHLATIMKFLLSEAPEGSQVIIAAETATQTSSALVVDVSHKKNRVLREDEYSLVSAYLQPLLSASISG